MHRWELKKTMEVSASHLLRLPYESKCSNLHGHNWIVEVHMTAHMLTPYGMVMDFGHIKEAVMQFDHTDLSNVFLKNEMNPTAENIAKLIADTLTEMIPTPQRGNCKVSKVTVIESEGNKICYIP